MSIDQDDSERDDADSEFSEAGPAEELDHDVPVLEHRPSVAAMRAGLRFLDDETLAQRAAVMKNIPKFLWGSFRVALRVALEEISIGSTPQSFRCLPTLPPYFELRHCCFFKRLANLKSLQATSLGSLPTVLFWRRRRLPLLQLPTHWRHTGLSHLRVPKQSNAMSCKYHPQRVDQAWLGTVQHTASLTCSFLRFAGPEVSAADGQMRPRLHALPRAKDNSSEVRASRSITALSLPVGLIHVLQECELALWPTCWNAVKCQPVTAALFDGTEMPTVWNRSGNLPISDHNEWPE